MKDSVRKLSNITPLALFCAAFLAAGCRRADKAVDVAQDSLLVKATDTAPTRSPSGITQMHPSSKPVTSNMPKPRMQPPKRITPPVILHGRDSARDTLHRN